MKDILKYISVIYVVNYRKDERDKGAEIFEILMAKQFSSFV